MAQTENTGLFEIKDGILTKYHGRQNNIVIPEGVTEIGRWAFSDRSSSDGKRLHRFRKRPPADGGGFHTGGSRSGSRVAAKRAGKLGLYC